MSPRRDGRGRSADGPVPLSESLSLLSRRMGVAGPDVLGVVFGHWEDIVGPPVAAHVRPMQLLDGTLVVSADHPAWASQVRHLTPEILEHLREACGLDDAPKRIEVRVRS